MSRSLEEFEFESVVTTAIAVLVESDNLEDLKNRIDRLNLPGLLKMEHEHEVTDELIEKCLKEVREFYGVKRT